MLNDILLNETTDKINFTVDKEVLFDTKVSFDKLKDSFNVQVHYHFPASQFRNPIMPNGQRYGEAWNFDILYRKLCAEFNDGQLFIDEYFANIFPYTLQEEMTGFLNEIKDDIISQYDEITKYMRVTVSGEFDKRFTTVLRPLLDFTLFAKEHIKEQGAYWSERIKEDIIMCMGTGSLPTFFMKQDNKESTRQKRKEAGLPEEPVFMASGQLIESIVIDVHLGKEQWKDEHYITV